MGATNVNILKKMLTVGLNAPSLLQKKLFLKTISDTWEEC